MRMSKRGRRNSRRRKSSSSSKHSISPCNFQKPTKSPADNVVYEDGIAEKGEADSLRKESILSESDEEEEKESEILSKEKRFSRESHGESFVNKNERPSIAEPGDKGPKITTSMTIDDFEQPSSKIVLKQSHESTAKGLVSSTIAVTTAKVQFISSNMRVEIKEMLQLDDSDIHTTLVLQSQKGKGTEACFQSKCKRRPTPNNESFAHHYSCNPNTTELHQNRKHENVSYKVSIAELSTEAKDTSRNQSLFKCREEMDCCKSCCKDHFYGHHTCSNNNDFTVVDGSSSLSPFSDFWLPEKKQSLPNNLSSQELWDIPPPHQFADREHNVLEDLAEDIASCQICTDDDFNARGAENMSEASRYKLESGCHSSLDEEQRANANSCSEQMSELDTDEPLFMRPTGPMSRSSFTKNVIYNHKMKTRLRNNSIAILESKTQPSGYVDKPVKRRKTFPGLADCSSQSQEGLSSHRESFSSGTLSSFFMQSLPLQAERSGRLYLEDDRLSPFGVENRKSSDCSSYTPSLSPVRGHNMFLPDITTYSRTKNPFKSEENLEEVIFQNGLYPKQMQADKHTVASEMEAGEMVCVDGADQDSTSADPVEQSEVAESAFDEEMVELDEPTEELRQRDLLIQVTPPSPYTSEERIIYGSPTTYTQREHQKRRGSVNTIITGGSEQRFLYSDSKPTEGVIPERHQMDISPSVLPIEDMEADRNCASLHTLTAELSTSTPSLTEPPTEATEPHTDTSPPSEQSGDDVKSSGEAAMALTEMCQKSCVAQDKVSTDGQQKPKLYQMHLAERQSVSKSSLEVKEHLKPPADPILKDPEDTSDHWAKRRKLFKESTQWSSAGGSCITSNTTESADTMNSEEACSVEVSARDIKDRGFYTETFHSAAWIYHGDDVKPAESPRCLSKRPRPVTIRERTVKIIRGPGDYPWGFRIQFSKPIVVTEVDTNGAAEEAGLQVGDYILAVNGTDVTSVPHSEAAELARHGPDILTLTIGSDISRCPNTPRPACRGYLHKRTQSSLIKGWRKRWFVLRHDCCLYYYRHKRDEGKRQPVSAMKLEGALVSADTSLGKPFVFKCSPVSGNRDYYLCATSNQEMKRWLEDMDRAVRPITQQNHVWVDVTRHNASLPPLAVKNPECLGLLHQLDKNKDVWVQHYCILKDGCLYFYPSFRSTYAIGGIYLHGYTVREQPLGSKKSTIELKPPSEEFKTFYLCAENPTENKRWMLAMKASLGKWLPLH